jgi:hypothetical protein
VPPSFAGQIDHTSSRTDNADLPQSCERTRDAGIASIVVRASEAVEDVAEAQTDGAVAAIVARASIREASDNLPLQRREVVKEALNKLALLRQ